MTEAPQEATKTTPQTPPPQAQSKCRICLKPFNPFPLGEKNGYTFEACKACGSVTTIPWPTQADIDKFYGDIQPEIVHAPNPQGRINQIKKHLNKLMPNHAGKRFLDVCTREGYAVVAAKELGFQAHGIDRHDFCVAFEKDKYDPHLFEHTTVQEYAEKGGQAEFIYVVEGFCEQRDPDDYAAALANILAPGGMIYIQEPDGNHIRLPANFPRWSFVYPPMNFSYISKKGMLILLARHGLKLQKKFFSWNPYMRLVIVHK
jgi:hypothetical protein